MQEYVFNYAEYKQRIYKPKQSHISVLMVIIIALMGVCVGLKQSQLSSFSFYFVEVSATANFSNANKQATKLSQENGAGVVYYDGVYHVLAATYIDEESTKKVATNIVDSYPKAKAFKISAPKFRGNQNFSKMQTRATNNLVKNITELRNKMMSDSINYDTSTTSFNQAKAALTDWHTSFSAHKTAFFDAFSENHDMFAPKKRLIDIDKALSDILSSEEQEFAQKFKCGVVNLTISFAMFLNEVC